MRSAAHPEQFPRDGLPEVAVLGRSNVGKSSLLNALARKKNLARVSSSPGRTQTVNFFRVGDEMYLADLPGYGYAKVPEAVRLGWEQMVTSYLVGREPLALCLFLVDSRHDPGDGDLVLRAFLEQHGLPYVVVATKVDKIARGQRARRMRGLQDGIGAAALGVVAVSAEDGTGLDALWTAIRGAVAETRA